MPSCSRQPWPLRLEKAKEAEAGASPSQSGGREQAISDTGHTSLRSLPRPSHRGWAELREQKRRRRDNALAGGSARARGPAHVTSVRGGEKRKDWGRGGGKTTALRRNKSQTPKADLRVPGCLRADLGPAEGVWARRRAEAAPRRPTGDAGHLARPGRPGRGAVRLPRRARPKWATSGAAPRAGRLARAPRGSKSARAGEGDSEPPPPPRLATSRAARTPLGPARGPGPALAAAAAGAHAVSRTHHLGSGVLLTPSAAAPPSVPLSDRTGGASRRYEAQPTQAALPPARRCPREGREGARAGWGRGASPCPPRAHAPAAPASLRVPLPREPRGHGALAWVGALTWEGGDCGFIFT